MKKRILFFLFILFFFCPKIFAAEKIDINSATLSQLDELTGIGPTYAQRIIDGRPYSSTDDLLRVKGIGPATLQKIKDQGLACVDCADPSLRGGSQADAAISTTVIASSPEAPRNDENKFFPEGIFVNEILANPEGADEQEEYFEILNSNNFDVDLSGWKIQDTAGTITTFTIPQNTKILANNFLVLKRTETKIMLNNDGDGLNLLTPDGKTENSASFAKAPLGQSYNKTATGWSWSATLTPGAKNIITAPALKSSSKTNSPALPKTEISDKNKPVELALADVSQKQNTSPWLLFFTALAVTLISAGVVLFARLKFKNYKNLKI